MDIVHRNTAEPMPRATMQMQSGMKESAQRPVDVSIFLQDLRGGGAERAFLRLARGMIASGRSVEIVLIRDHIEYKGELPEGARIVDLGAGRVAAGITAYARHLRRTKPRAILSALTHVNVACVIARTLSGHKAPLIVSERNQFSAKLGAASNMTDRIAYRLAPRAYRHADKVVCVSEGVAEDVRQATGLGPDKVIAIHNPSFDPKAVARKDEAPSHPWFAAPDPAVKTIMAVGRLNPQKGFDTLISAFAKLKARLPARLVIFGEGNERAALEQQAAELGLTEDEFQMPGFTQNPFALFARADLFVLSSRWEGFPNVLVEAMACGAPVVATDCPSGPREIFEPGTLDRLVTVDDVDGLAGEMHRVLTNPPDRDTLIARASLFSVDVASAKYLEVLGL